MKIFTKLLYPIFFMIISIFSVEAQQNNNRISNVRAFDIVKKKILIDSDASNYWIYTSKSPYQKNDTIEIWNRKIILPYENSWLFFVDKQPFANWTHHCEYIFINTNTGEYTIVEETHPPKSYDNLKLLTSVSIPSGTTYNFKKSNSSSSRSQLKSATIEPASYNNKYAVIISGGYNKDNNHIRYWNDCAAIYSTLINRYNFQRNRIFVIMADGTDPAADRHLINGSYDSSPLDLDGDGTNDVYSEAKKYLIQNLFTNLGTYLTPEDFLYVFTTDHGGQESGQDAILYLWGETMRDDEFAIEVNKVNAGKIVVTMEQCNSGGFIDDLAGVNRIIATAAKYDEVSYATSDALYNEFVYHWTAAALGAYPNGTVVNADANGDGFVSMEEAFNYSNDHDTKSEHPQYNSNPSELGTQQTLYGFEINSNLHDIIVTSGNTRWSLAYNNITATSYIVQNGGTVNFRAGNAISLQTGFSAQSGSSFHAFIQPFTLTTISASTLLKSGNTSDSFTNESVDLIENDHALLDLRVFPNPSKGMFYLQFKDLMYDANLLVKVFNLNGRLVCEQNVSSDRLIIDLSNQPSGLYLLQITGNNINLSKKILKNE